LRGVARKSAIRDTSAMAQQRRLFVDMDNVLVDFASGIARLPDQQLSEYEGRLDEVPGIFALMDPMPGAIAAFEELADLFEVYILSTAPWLNPSAWTDKVEWVQRWFGSGRESKAYKRLILTHHKNLVTGAFLIDDRTSRGVDVFHGAHLHFGTERFPDWDAVLAYLRPWGLPRGE
jgi:5'-nucleotidase